MTTFRDKLSKVPGLTQAQAMIMSMQAAAGIAGHTPKEWQPMIMANAQSFGITDPEIAQMVATGEIDLLQPGSLQAGIIKKNALIFDGKRKEKVMERQLAVTSTPEGVQAMSDQLASHSAPPAASPGAAPVGAGSPAAPQQTPGEIDRAIKTQQVTAETEAKEKVQKRYRLAPEKEIIEVRALDDMYTKGIRLLQLGEGDKQSGTAGLIDRYGSYPGTFVDWYNKMRASTGSLDKETAEYISTISGFFNIEKKEFAGTAASLNERSDLKYWIPDPTDNVRTALQKIGFLVKAVKADLDRNTKHIASNYPGTDLSSLKYNQIQQRRLARQQEQGGQQPVVSAPPPPPTPQPQSQPAPAPAPQPSATPLPPIQQQVERAKAANPSEAAPKFGPGSTKSAADLVPQSVQQSLTKQDKVDLANAMHQYSRGQLDDKALELAVAKVLMRAGSHVGKKNLEGQALNKAVTAWTEVLRRGAKSKKEFARGQ